MIREMLGIAEGILQDLHNDHEEVSSLIVQMLKSKEAQKRSALFKEMTTKLLAHSHAEHSVLYRKLEKSTDEAARKFALQGANEHQIVEQQLQQLARARNKMSEQWTAQLCVLRDLVSHDVDEEEGTGFGCIRREFEREELDKMGQQFQRQKERLMAEA